MNLKFNPTSGVKWVGVAVNAEQFRARYGGAWDFNPWTGEKRPAFYVTRDPYGIGIGLLTEIAPPDETTQKLIQDCARLEREREIARAEAAAYWRVVTELVRAKFPTA